MCSNKKRLSETATNRLQCPRCLRSLLNSKPARGVQKYLNSFNYTHRECTPFIEILWLTNKIRKNSNIKETPGSRLFLSSFSDSSVSSVLPYFILSLLFLSSSKSDSCHEVLKVMHDRRVTM